MSAEEWERIKTIFESALSLVEEDREAYLKACCGDKSALYDAVKDLLENYKDVSPVPRQTGQVVRAFQENEVVAGRFRILRFIERGGMGEVYEAYDERLRMRLALKTLRPELIATQDALERFNREILVARGVAHENLCKVYEFVEHRSSGPTLTNGGCIIPCFTMELIEGTSLAQHLARLRPLQGDIALPLIRQIAAALDALHEHGIIHRDLTTSNIMLAKSRHDRVRAVVMDFGLAKAERGDTDLFESRSECQAGAPYFMAPELFRNGHPSTATDVYAFGLIIDEMLTRSRAFSAQSPQALFFAKLWERPIPPRQRSEHLPEYWERTILRCLHPDPQQRFARASEVVTALEGRAPHLLHGLASTDSANTAVLKRSRPGRRALVFGILPCRFWSAPVL